MNTVNQTFDWSRFTATLRKELVENKRAILFTLLGTFGLLTIIMILGNLSTSTHDAVYESLTYCVPQKFVYMFLTSPSSMLEKFLVNALVYVIGYIVAFFICTQLADLTRIAVLWFFKDEYLIVPGPINFLNLIPDAVDGFGFGSAAEIPGEPTKWMTINLMIGLLAGPGLFLLGSIVWPRLSLLKTFAAVYGLETILGITFMIVAINLNMETVGWWIINHLEQIMIAMTIFTVFQLILYWGLSWYLFKRKDVISLKWWK